MTVSGEKMANKIKMLLLKKKQGLTGLQTKKTNKKNTQALKT